ncbi:MAG: ADP-ribosylglycohydrolase family protein [Planctomycetota bacterium]|nr:ADP-ribosylglycohydrolase family protein [Planctomycetota bacterium]
MANYHLSDKSIGALLGMAVGNALGAPASGLSKEELKERFGTLQAYEDSFDLEEFAETASDMDERDKTYKVSRWLPKGVYTGDTQQALILCESLIMERGYNSETFAELLCKFSHPRGRNFRFGIYRGAGRSFRDSIRSLEDGVDTRKAGQPSSSNGAAMRVAPLGLFYGDDLDALKKHVIEQSVLTHRDVMAVAAAQAIAHLVALVLPMRRPPCPSELLAHLLEHVRQAEELAAETGADFITNLGSAKNGFSTALAKVSDYLDLDLEKGISKIGEYAESTSDRPGIGGTGGYVLSSVITSIYVFLKNVGTFERAVIAAINQGGATDTIGAIVGAVSGALHGPNSIPARLVRGVSNANHLELKAKMLVDETVDVRNARTLSEFESQLTERILDLRKPHLPEPQESERRPDGRRRDDRRGGGRSRDRR